MNPQNPHYLQLDATGAFALDNNGYWGMNIVQGDSYTFRAALRSDNFSKPLTVRIISPNGSVLASGSVLSLEELEIRIRRPHRLDERLQGSS